MIFYITTLFYFLTLVCFQYLVYKKLTFDVVMTSIISSFLFACVCLQTEMWFEYNPADSGPLMSVFFVCMFTIFLHYIYTCCVRVFDPKEFENLKSNAVPLEERAFGLYETIDAGLNDSFDAVGGIIGLVQKFDSPVRKRGLNLALPQLVVSDLTKGVGKASRTKATNSMAAAFLKIVEKFVNESKNIILDHDIKIVKDIKSSTTFLHMLSISYCCNNFVVPQQAFFGISPKITGSFLADMHTHCTEGRSPLLSIFRLCLLAYVPMDAEDVQEFINRYVVVIDKCTADTQKQAGKAQSKDNNVSDVAAYVRSELYNLNPHELYEAIETPIMQFRSMTQGNVPCMITATRDFYIRTFVKETQIVKRFELSEFVGRVKRSAEYVNRRKDLAKWVFYFFGDKINCAASSPNEVFESPSPNRIVFFLDERDYLESIEFIALTPKL
jgi:hypothetical protein